MPYGTSDIRNVALAGHPGGGKATLFEALLQLGGTGGGPAVTAGAAAELGVASIDHVADADGRNFHLNFVDTPGYPEFGGASLAALAAVETAVIVVDADATVDHGMVRLMARARERGLCRAIVVSRIDHEHADCGNLLDQLRATFGAEVLPVNLPADWGRRVVDCLACAQGASDLGPVALWHQRLIAQVLGAEPAPSAAQDAQRLAAAFAAALRQGRLVPVLFVSARNGVGLPELLDTAERLFPQPQVDSRGGPATVRRNAHGEGPLEHDSTLHLDAGPDSHVVADVFKVVDDPSVGTLGVFRVHQGTVRRDSQLFVDAGQQPFRVSQLFKLRGQAPAEVEQAIAGDIVALGHYAPTHHERGPAPTPAGQPTAHAPVHHPRPVFALAVRPMRPEDMARLHHALQLLAGEDPGFGVERHRELGETVIHGLSELHLRVMVERLRERFGLHVRCRPPRIAYRETIATCAEGYYRHTGHGGGGGHGIQVRLRVEPLPRGAGVEFVDALEGGRLTGRLLAALEQGVRQALLAGAISGHPLQDLRVVVVDGSHPPAKGINAAFLTAGHKALLDAVAKAGPQVLEPLVRMELSAADAHLGDVSGALAARRARILGTDRQRLHTLVQALVPQAELDGFAAELRSLTAGKGRYALEFSHYEPVPAAVQQQLAAAWMPGDGQD